MKIKGGLVLKTTKKYLKHENTKVNFTCKYKSSVEEISDLNMKKYKINGSNMKMYE